MSEIGPKDWDPPEYLPISDRRFLIDRAQTMHHVQQVAFLTMGQILLQVREKFKNDPNLNGWWMRWIDEATPINRPAVDMLMNIARAAQSSPEFLEMTQTHAKTVCGAVAKLPESIRRDVCKCIKETGQVLKTSQIEELANSPEVELAGLEEALMEAQIRLAEVNLKYANASDSQERSRAKRAVNLTQSRITMLQTRLSESRTKVKELEKIRSTQELLVSQLNRQVRKKELQLEETRLDPDAKRKRAVAKTIVQASNGLDLLLQSFDRYVIDKEDIGEEAIKSIELKLEQLKQKLMTYETKTL